MKIFSYDSKFSQIIMKIADGCILNALWFITSLPIFTLGASTTALYRVTLNIVDEKDGNISQQYFKAFKENFRQATQIWLILLPLGLFLGLDGYILSHLRRSGNQTFDIVCTLGLALIIVAAIVYVMVFLYVFPLVASVKNTNIAMIKNSFFIAIRYLFCTILLAAIHFAMFFVVVALFTPLIIFGEGVVALLCSYLLINVIRACSYDPNAPKEDLSEEEEE